jgi:chromosome segregation protein
MFLKRITLSGFKSFCDRVDFDFGPGITCVVGPNGCGKSNVVDALKWVLGEQSAHSLRGRQMLDMIFNGSATRRSSSVAQVDLLFDNADHALPLERDEVLVTRKLYRSGESEYLLNNEASRLKDVRGLFLDTGVGVEAYSIIEQGKVDSLLQSSPQERRVIFEEAAGISRYKARKREAERKLERTHQNLLRVNDIIEELEKRLRSVKLQAGKARNYLEYEGRLKELKASFSLAEFHKLSEGLRDLEVKVAESTDRVTSLRTDINRREADGAQATVQLDALAEQINSADQRLIRARAECGAQQERMAAAEKRREEQTALRGQALERHANGVQRFEETRAELSDVEDSARELEQRTQGLRLRVDGLHEQDRVLARELTRQQAVLEDEKAGIIDLLRRSAHAHNEVVRLHTHRESLVDHKGRVAQRDAQVAAELEGHCRQQAELEYRVRGIESLLIDQTRALEEKKADSDRVQSVRQRLLEETATTKERRSALQSRREVLQDLERRREGVGAGVRWVLDALSSAVETGRSVGILGLVADLFETDVAHARVVEAILGDWDQCLVAAESAGLENFLASRSDAPGRVTAFCLDRLPPRVNVRDLSDLPGVVARAVDWVRFDPDLEPLALQLFGKTIVVENCAAAAALQRDDVHGHRFVTVDGVVFEPDGRMGFGPPTTAAGLISRKSELKDIDAQLAVAESRILSLADQLNRTQAEVTHLEVVQQELRTAIYDSNTTKVETAAALQSVSDSIDRLTQERPLLAREVTMLDEQINGVLSRTEEQGRLLATLEEDNQKRQAHVESIQQRIDGIVDERRSLQEQLTETRVLVGQLTEKRSAVVEAMTKLRAGLAEWETAVNAAHAEAEQCRDRIAEAEAAFGLAGQETARLQQLVAEMDAESVSLRQRREALRLQWEELSQAVKEGRSQLTLAETELHEREMSVAQLRVHRENLSARIKEELGIDLAERHAQYQPEEADWAQVEAEIAELRAKMDRLGHVNLDAITELAELEERHGFLNGQRNDLDEARRQLEQLIEKLNAESQERFRVTLDLVREHFRGMFRRLFGGGRADIILEDPANILDCGIEIVAQPPGKELQAISLMSGGEKSMTAIALLMSIFKCRPAPFAVMDEVDAALDEANNDRFNRILQEFVKEVQFVVITHSKWTMNGADRLYGITMQEPGVSTRVGVQLSGANVA